MFRPFTRLPLRRALHTSAHRPQNGRLTLLVGISSAMAAYTAWRVMSDETIRLDSSSVPGKQMKSTPLATLEPPLHPASTTAPPSYSEHSTQPQPSEKQTDELETPEADKSEGGDGDGQTDEAPSEGEEEGGGAFNPVTGEINWDCPCLGGMAHGPCGPEFREAFSCFVYSEEEPKGIECVEKFKAMQNCFREHPEVYKDEIMDDDDDDEQEQVKSDGTLETPASESSQPEPTAEETTLSPTSSS